MMSSHRVNGQEFHRPPRLLQTGRVLSNIVICRDHFRLSILVPRFPHAMPGQFLHLAPLTQDVSEYRTFSWDAPPPDFAAWTTEREAPMLRRAYSVADLRPTASGVELDLIYRVVGKGTQWLKTLRKDDELSVLGPLGNSFPISATKNEAWLIAGGVGLPPLLWLAKFLQVAYKNTIMFYGAQTADLLAVRLQEDSPPDSHAREARPCVEELTSLGARAVLSSDDGSIGFHGHVGVALDAFANARPPNPRDVVVYTCGPERMMRFVADFCVSRGIQSYVCMERAMACGTGTCQSCAVSIHAENDPDDWRYSLCCTEGPVYAAEQVIWVSPAAQASPSRP